MVATTFIDDEVELLTISALANINFFGNSRTTVIAQLVAEMEAQREAAGISLAELLDGLQEERHKLYQIRSLRK